LEGQEYPDVCENIPRYIYFVNGFDMFVFIEVHLLGSTLFLHVEEIENSFARQSVVLVEETGVSQREPPTWCKSLTNFIT